MPHSRDRSLALLWLAIAGLLLLRLPLLVHRTFDPDEFEHAHAAWCLFKGMLPYQDFFEHHTPWYYFTLRPFFHLFEVDASLDSGRRFLIFGRGLSLVLALISLVFTARLGREATSRRVGVVAALLLVAQPLFLKKSVELRPDMLALPFFLAALGVLVRAMAGQATFRKGPFRGFAAAGLCLGAAIMCSQKMLFVLPGLLAGLVLWSRAGGRAASRLALIGVFLLGTGLPCVLTWAAFVVRHGGRAFIANNFLLNARWKYTTTWALPNLVKTSAPILVLAAVGVLGTAWECLHSRQRDLGEVSLAATLLGLFVGVLIIPVAQEQYYLMPLPLACLFAAKGLFLLVDRLPSRGFLLAVAAAGLSILPIIGLRHAYAARNDAQLARLREVYATTQRTDVVMDGWEGIGVFRPHAFYYYFIHDEILPMLDGARVDAFLDDLESGRIRPQLIALDKHLVALGPRFLRFVARAYVTRDGFLYYARS